MAFIHTSLENIWYDDAVKAGDKIDVYKFYDEIQVTCVAMIYRIAADHNMDIQALLTRYFPDIEADKKTTYTYIRTEKWRGDRWLVLQQPGQEENTHIDLCETYLCFYSVHTLIV